MPIVPLDPRGFTPPTLEELRASIDARARALFGDSIRIDDDSVFGRLFRLFSGALFDVYEGMQALVDQSSPDNAEGVYLDNVCALVGVVRRKATYSVGVVTCTGLEGTAIGAGKLVRTPTGETFLTLRAVVVPEGGSVDVDVRAELIGAVEALSGEISEIVTPVAGWQSVANAADVLVGSDIESDASLRLRRERSLAEGGAGTSLAISTEVEGVDGVVAVRVVNNRTSETDAEGRPPKSFEVVVWPDSGLDEEEITRAIALSMPVGVQSWGSVVATVLDEYDQEETVRWSYAERVELFVTVSIETSAEYPADGDERVASAFLAVANGVSTPETVEERALSYIVGDGLQVGESVDILRLEGALATVRGVKTALVALGTSDPPLGTGNYPIERGQIAVFDSSRIEVVHV